jgi:hypothetical protein
MEAGDDQFQCRIVEPLEEPERLLGGTQERRPGRAG